MRSWFITENHSGVRYYLNEKDLAWLSQEQRAAHDRFRLWRDKHIAHLVNVFEQNQPIARYCVERVNDEGFTSIECNSIELIGMSLSDVEMAIKLTSHFIEKLKTPLQIEKEKVLGVVRTLPILEVLAIQKPVKAPNMKDVGKARKQRMHPRGQ